MITPIGPAGGTMPVFPTTPPVSPNAPPATAESTFSTMVGNMIKETEAAQGQADKAVKDLISGQTQDIHQVMLAMEQARLSMLMMVEMRNKVVEAYQELSRMPL
jgi:flagellar hook-basal body complex protein FliE